MARPAEELQRMIEPVEALGALTLYEPHMIGYTPQCVDLDELSIELDEVRASSLDHFEGRLVHVAHCRALANVLYQIRCADGPATLVRKGAFRAAGAAAPIAGVWRVARLGTTRLTMPTACKQGQNDLAPHTWIAVHSQGTS